MTSDPTDPDFELPPDTDANGDEHPDPDPMIARVKKVARKIEDRVRKTLTDTESDKDTPSGGTEVSPPLPPQP